MRRTMFFTFAAAVSVLFSMGLAMLAPNESNSQCPRPREDFKNGTITIHGFTVNCTCNINGEIRQHTDGTKCLAGQGKIGNCSNGDCKVTASSFGCAGMTGKENGTTIHRELCTFECDKQDGSKGWAFLQDGTPCVNQDGENKDWKNGTCRHRPGIDRTDQNETVCIPNDQLHLLGC
uniref:Putative secreted protein n=1 Tax=Amblyomma americanum TaxID=6943 RepID=A0A0C9SDZ3_AMBAM